MNDESPKLEAMRYLGMLFQNTVKAPKPTGMSVYKPRPTDIVIATYPKAGTTLLQQMTYQVAVATGGAPDFDPDGNQFKDIIEVVPWVEYGPEFGVLECPSDPRIFKSHFPVRFFDKNNSKFIVIVRNPLDFPASFMDFLFEPFVGHLVEDEDVRREAMNLIGWNSLIGAEIGKKDVEEGHPKRKLFDHDGVMSATWFDFHEGWIMEKHDNVLVLFYEEVKNDLESTARKVAKFMGREITNEAVKLVAERCNRKTMAGDDRFASPITAKGLGMEGRMDVRTVRLPEKSGFKKFKLDDDLTKACEEKMKDVFGVATYNEFRAMMRERHQLM